MVGEFSRRGTALGVALLLAAVVSGAVSAQPRSRAFYETLAQEGGIAENLGSSIHWHVFIRRPVPEVSKYFSSDLSKLQTVLSSIGTITPFIDDSNTKMIQVKVAGLGRTETVTMRIVSGGEGLFGAPSTRPMSISQFNGPGGTDEAQKSLILEGPDEELIGLKSTQFRIEFEFRAFNGTYWDAAKGESLTIFPELGTILTVKATPAFRRPRTGLATPFRQRESELAKSIVQAMLGGLSAKIEKL